MITKRDKKFRTATECVYVRACEDVFVFLRSWLARQGVNITAELLIRALSELFIKAL